MDPENVWNRYCTLATDAQMDIPSSFQSRRNTFKDKLARHLVGIYKVTVLHDQARNEPHTVLVPSKFRHIPVSAMLQEDSTDIKRLIPAFKHEDQDMFLTMVHVALRIRGDMLSHSKPEGINVSEDRPVNSIPDSLCTHVFELAIGWSASTRG